MAEITPVVDGADQHQQQDQRQQQTLAGGQDIEAARAYAHAAMSILARVTAKA